MGVGVGGGWSIIKHYCGCGVCVVHWTNRECKAKVTVRNKNQKHNVEMQIKSPKKFDCFGNGKSEMVSNAVAKAKPNVQTICSEKTKL